MSDVTPLEIFRRKQIDATDRSSAQWSKVPTAHRTNALFSAHVEKAALLQRMQTLLDDYLAGARESVTLPDGTQTTVGKVQGKADFIKQMREFMINEGMDPDAKNNKITNIGARSRLSLIFDTQVRAAYGQARWEQGMTEDMLKAYPAWRFVRNPGARVKRELHVRNEGAVRLKTNYQFWAQEMNAADIGGFTVPWPPFGFNSYMDLEAVSATECEQLGIKVPKAQSLKQNAHANQKFGSRAPERANRAKASTKSIKDPDLLAQLKAELKALVGEDVVDEKGQLKVSNAQLGKIIEQKNAAKANPNPPNRYASFNQTAKQRTERKAQKLLPHTNPPEQISAPVSVNLSLRPSEAVKIGDPYPVAPDAVFTEASDRAEAVKFTRTMGQKVSFAPHMTLEQINEYNRTLFELKQRFKAPHLCYLGSYEDADDVGGYADAAELKINHDKQAGGINGLSEWLDFKTEEERKRQTKLNEKADALRNGEKNRVEAIEEELKQIDEEIRRMQTGQAFARNNVGMTPKGIALSDIIIHEFGHVLHRSTVKMQMRNKREKYNLHREKSVDSSPVSAEIRKTLEAAQANGDLFWISKYARKDEQEFFAECFVAWYKGEKLPDYIEQMILNLIAPYLR